MADSGWSKKSPDRGISRGQVRIRLRNADGAHHRPHHLVAERVAGRSLQKVIASRERISTRRMLNYCKNMAEIVADIHAAGWAWRDCKPAKFYCQKNHRMRALDFEGEQPKSELRSSLPFLRSSPL